VPLSRQLIEQAAEGVDLGTAEGRARMLAQAKPLWSALPDGALKRQLLPELARQAQLEPADLSGLWGNTAAPTAARPRHTQIAPPLQAPLRRAGRRAPAAPADLALRLLLRHSDWWERLGADDHELLHGMGGIHGEVIGWLERQLTEHGPQTWSTLESALAHEPWHAEARAWVNTASPDEEKRFAAAPDEEQHFDHLHRVMQALQMDRLNGEAQQLVATATEDSATKERLRALRQQIARIKAALATAPD
jgi:DNA primase